LRPIRVSRDRGRCSVDRGHKVDMPECVDGAALGAQAIQGGVRRAEEARRRRATRVLNDQEEDLPSECYPG
jgi:hypothetical protein